MNAHSLRGVLLLVLMGSLVVPSRAQNPLDQWLKKKIEEKLKKKNQPQTQPVQPPPATTQPAPTGQTGNPPAAAAAEPAKAEVQNPDNSPFANVPEPDTFSRFKLYMASNYDIIDTQGFAWRYYVMFKYPRNGSRECLDLDKQLKNEFTRRELLAKARAELKPALVEAQSWPKTATYRLKSREHFAEYDFEKRAFTFERYGGFSVTNQEGLLDLRRYFQPPRGSEYGSPAQQPCMMAVGFHADLASETLINPNLNLALTGLEKIREVVIPMDPDQARLIRTDNSPMERLNSGVDVEIIVEAGPAVRKLVNGNVAPIPARIIAARVVNPPDGRVLYAFDPALFGSSIVATGGGAQSKSPDATAGGSVPLTSYRVDLLAVRDNPQLLDGASVEFAKRQIRAEGELWQAVYNMEHPKDRHDKNKELPPFYGKNLNPKRPLFIFEWQRLMDSRPELARGALMDVFIKPDADWSFVKREPEWDDRFDAIVGVCLFSRESVEGRNPEFAARELAPVMKNHLQLASTKAPTKFWFPVRLPGWDYDFDAKAIRFFQEGKKDPHEPLNLLGPVANPVFDAPPQGSREYATLLPASARSTLIYSFPSGGRAEETRAEKPGRKVLNISAEDLWRDNFPTAGQSGSGTLGIPNPGMLALDRQLMIAGIPMDPRNAEKLMSGKSLSSGEGGSRGGQVELSARIYIEADHVELARTTYEGKPSPFSILFARVQKVEILGLKDELVATLGPQTFRGAKESLAAAAAAQAKAEADERAREAEKAAQAKKEKSTNQLLEETRQENLRRSQEAAAETQKKADEIVRKQIAESEKRYECGERAAKVNPKPDSPEHKRAFDACMKEK